MVQNRAKAKRVLSPNITSWLVIRSRRKGYLNQTGLPVNHDWIHKPSNQILYCSGQ